MSSGGWRMFEVSSFFGPAARGNCHTLCYNPCSNKEPEGFFAAELPRPLETLPNLIVLSGSAETLAARFVNEGRPVKRCGSGNIAIAAFVHRCLGAHSDLSGSWRLDTPAGRVTLGYDALGPYYLDHPLGQTPLREPALWRGILGVPFVDGCYCGGPGDYALLEVSQSLHQLKPHVRRLRLLSRRALILLRRTVSGQAELRYFAPQYGPHEDAATGSASVQAARYLWYRYGQSQCAFAQKSPEGGYIHTQLRSPLVAVRGQAEVRGLSQPGRARLKP